jgi:DNA ligase-associated metallophosphoesterase
MSALPRPAEPHVLSQELPQEQPQELPHALRIGALEAVAHESGALWLPMLRTLLVADLHLEKGSAYAARGVFLPPYDSRATLAVLSRVIARFNPTCVIALGDSFHDDGGSGRLPEAEREALHACQQGRDWVWLAGNHDRLAPAGVGGAVAAELTLADVLLRHEPRAGESGHEIAGHLHPAARVRLRGRALRRKCFVTDGRRLVMPAMGAYAGGLNVRDRAFQPLFSRGMEAWVLGEARVFRIGDAWLLPD